MPRGRRRKSHKSHDSPGTLDEEKPTSSPGSSKQQQELRALLWQRKSVWSRYRGQIQRLLLERDPPPSSDIVSSTLKRAKCTFSEIEETYDELSKYIDPCSDDFCKHVEWFEDIESRHIEFCKEAVEWLDACDNTGAIMSAASASALNTDANPFVPKPSVKETDPTPTNPNEPNLSDLGHMLSALHLPQPEIERFSGDPTEFLGFIQAFRARVCRVTPSPSDRLYYLHQHLAGEARELVSGCLYMSEERGYDEAMRALNLHYGQAHIVCDAFVRKFQHLAPVKQDDARGLKSLFLMVNKCYCVMNSLDDASVLDFPTNIQMIVRKFPPYLQYRWRDKVSKLNFEGRRVKFADLVDFLNVSSSAANDPIYGQDAMTHSVSDSSAAPSRVSSHAVSNVERVLQCYFCKGSHMLNACKTFSSRSIAERREFVKEHRLCFSCLGANHRAASCKRKGLCAVCHKAHPTAMHDNSENATNDVTSALQPNHSFHNGACDAQSDPFHGTSSNDHVMHAILPVQVTLGENSVMTYAFYDNGSSGSFITEHLMGELKAEGCPEVALQLTTMHGRSTSSSHLVRDLRVSDFEGNNPIKVPKLYSRSEISVSKKHIPRPSKMRKNSSLERFVDLVPPFMDNLEIGLLIGVDCPTALEPMELLPSANGAYACRLRHGWTVIGPSTSEQSAIQCGSMRVQAEPAPEALMGNSDFDESKSEEKQNGTNDVDLEECVGVDGPYHAVECKEIAKADLNKDGEEKNERLLKHAREMDIVKTLQEEINVLEAKLTQLKASIGDRDQQLTALQDELEESRLWKEKYDGEVKCSEIMGVKVDNVPTKGDTPINRWPLARDTATTSGDVCIRSVMLIQSECSVSLFDIFSILFVVVERLGFDFLILIPFLLLHY